MYSRVVIIFFSVCVFGNSVYANNFMDPSQCDSRLIQYSWEQKYGGMERPNSGGKTLFNEAVDFMLSAAKGGDKNCAEAYLLVVEYILTKPDFNARMRGKNEEYLVKKIQENITHESEMTSEIIGNAPTVNALWNDYQFYLENKENLETEYAQISASIITSYCLSDYNQENHSSDYDTYMQECTSSWQ